LDRTDDETKIKEVEIIIRRNKTTQQPLPQQTKQTPTNMIFAIMGTNHVMMMMQKKKNL
jgi:hypothetical protein